MAKKYDNNFKSMIVNLICNEKHSTIKTAEQFDLRLKTVEKWITLYNKDKISFYCNVISVYADSNGLYGTIKIASILNSIFLAQLLKFLKPCID